MRLSKGCRLTYTVRHEAWYAQSVGRDRREIGIHASHDGGGVEWEFVVVEYDFGKGAVPHLEMFSDSWAAFEQVPELFAGLRDEADGADLEAVIGLLDQLGAVDVTERRERDDDGVPKQERRVAEWGRDRWWIVEGQQGKATPIEGPYDSARAAEKRLADSRG